MVTHSVKAASHAGRVLFIRDGEVFHQIYRGSGTNEQLYQKISDTLTLLATQPGRVGTQAQTAPQSGNMPSQGQQAMAGEEGTV